MPSFQALFSAAILGAAASGAAPASENGQPSLTPADGRAFELQVLRQVADLALVPPRLNTSPLPEYDYDQLDYGMTIGITRTPHGRIWAAWVAGGDSPLAFMVAATSDDDGETWSKPRLVINSQAKHLPIPRSVIVGNLWTDPQGRVWFFFDQTMNHFDGRGGLWATTCENPDAEQPAWSEPRRIWHGSALNKPIVLANGEWMLPVQLLQNSGIGPFAQANLFPELDPYRGANVFVSSDRGARWERRGHVVLPNPNWHEHMVVERKDGSLWMVARTSKGLVETTSVDQGKTWSEPTPSTINHPVARFHLRRLASGRILLVKHGDTVEGHEGRSKLKAFLSEDEGRTWKGGLMLDERKGISYPDGFQAPDGRIYISYDRNRSSDGEILLAKFTEKEVLSGEISEPGSKLKTLISRPLKPREAKPAKR